MPIIAKAIYWYTAGDRDSADEATEYVRRQLIKELESLGVKFDPSLVDAGYSVIRSVAKATIHDIEVPDGWTVKGWGDAIVEGFMFYEQGLR